MSALAQAKNIANPAELADRQIGSNGMQPGQTFTLTGEIKVIKTEIGGKKVAYVGVGVKDSDRYLSLTS